MKTHRFFPVATITAVISLLLLASSVFSENTLMAYRGQVEIDFAGKSTLHAFEGTGESKPFTLSVRVDSVSGDTLLDATISVRSEALATEDEKLNKNMYKTIESDTYPTITAWLQEIPLKDMRSPDGQFQFRLKVRDITSRITASVSNFSQSPDSVMFALTFDFSISDYQLEPPTPVFGLIKMDDIMNISCRFRMESVKE